MKAIVLRELGGPEVLRLEEVPMPRPAPDEILIRVGAVSVNRSFDLLVRQDGNGRNPVLPLVLGADPSGEVVEVGAEVRDFAVGDRVAVEGTSSCGQCANCRRGQERACLSRRMIGVHRWGGYAEYVAVPARQAYRIPDNLSFPEATVVLRHFPTAFAMVHQRAELRAGETVLVMGAAGALGSCLVQVCKLAGATVIAGAGADERVAAAIEIGADHGVNYRRQDLAAECQRLTDGEGVQVVFENIADPTLWPGAFDSLAYGGRLVTNGAHGGGQVTLNVRKLYHRRLSILGGIYHTRENVERALAEAQAGRLKPLIGAILPLEQASRAHELAALNQIPGKVILVPHP